MQVLASGIAAGAGTITVGSSASLLMVRAATAAVISINGKQINLPTTAVNYTAIPVSYDDFAIVSGTVDYICLG